jgi:hypothetical protein
MQIETLICIKSFPTWEPTELRRRAPWERDVARGKRAELQALKSRLVAGFQGVALAYFW